MCGCHHRAVHAGLLMLTAAHTAPTCPAFTMPTLVSKHAGLMPTMAAKKWNQSCPPAGLPTHTAPRIELTCPASTTTTEDMLPYCLAQCRQTTRNSPCADIHCGRMH